MTPEERTGYRDKMRNAKTQAERDQIRAEHHATMQGRAKEKGVTLPDQPCAGVGAVASPEEAQESAPAWIKGVLRPAQQTADPAALFR